MNNFKRQHIFLNKIHELRNKKGIAEQDNQELKEALLFYLDVSVSLASSNYTKDMEYWCRKLLNCSHEEARKRYGDYKYEQEWELG